VPSVQCHRPPIVPAVLLALALLASCAMGCGGGTDDGSPSGAAALRVVVERPGPADAELSMVLPGSLEAWEMAQLYARVTGYLEKVAVDIGDEVGAGDELARIVVPEMAADLERADADVASARADVERQQAEFELAEITGERLSALRRREKAAVPQQDVDAAAANARVEQARLAAARAHLDAARAERARLEALSNFAGLRAPFAGRITRRVLHAGALAREGTSSDAEPVVEIARTDRLRLVFMVPEPMVPHVRTGQAVHVRLDAFPAEDIEATIARTAGALDPATRSMRAEVDLENTDGKLRPGMYAAVDLTVEVDRAGSTVASRAVRGRGGERFVLVVRDGVLHRQPVTVAADDGRRAVIAAGVGADDVVMVAGSPLAAEGSAVEPVEAGR